MPQSGTARAIPNAPATPGAESAPILLIGQDRAGHWIVRETRGLLGGIFIDRAAAIRFARAEQRGFAQARIEMATAPLPSPLAR